MKIAVRRLIGEEKGQALVLVLILLLVGGLVIAPLLDFMGTGLKVGKEVYENKMYETYAADAGVEDGLWQIRYDGLVGFAGYDEYGYYDYNTDYQWSYLLDENVNDYSVNVTIMNVWMPKDIPAPDADTAQEIIEEGKLIIAGGPSVTEESTYEIKISYARGCPADPLPNVNTIGIWLPPGFEYVEGSSDLEKDTGEPYHCVPDIDPYKGGYAVVWTFASVPLEDFPGGNPEDNPMVITFTFEYEGPEEQSPDNAVSWIDTTGVGGIDYTWDADVKVYKILSVAGDCTVEAYAAKRELRKLGSGISGDYHAIGSTLMTPTGDEKYRDRLYKESSATIAEGDIPSNAIIEKAWLYWSGWIEGASGSGSVIWAEDCNDFEEPVMDWTAGSVWDYDNGRFRGTAYNKADPGRYLTMASSIELSAYVGQTVEVSWQQDEDGSLENGDRLYYAFSKDGGITWSADYEAFRNDNPESPFTTDPIPDEYLTDEFKMRFYLDGFNEWDCYRWVWIWCIDEGPEYCYIDNITISLEQPLVEDAKVNRVMFGTTGKMVEIAADPDDCQVEPTPDSGAPESWSYSCFYDVTNLELEEDSSVKAIIEEEMHSGGSGSLTFTLGHVLEGSEYSLYGGGKTDYPLATPASSTASRYQWTYAGWSLLIIYSSPETQGHQLYLFDTFRYVGQGGDPAQVPFSISGFLAPEDTTGSHLTYFVGEGDDHWTGDSIEINGYELPRPGDPYEPSPGFNPQNNVFNSYSNSLDDTYLSGVDIDTFDMSECIEPDDTSADVVLITVRGEGHVAEIYNLVYIILSFRSDVTSGGSMSYLIRG